MIVPGLNDSIATAKICISRMNGCTIARWRSFGTPRKSHQRIGKVRQASRSSRPRRPLPKPTTEFAAAPPLPASAAGAGRRHMNRA